MVFWSLVEREGLRLPQVDALEAVLTCTSLYSGHSGTLTRESGKYKEVGEHPSCLGDLAWPASSEGRVRHGI